MELQKLILPALTAAVFFISGCSDIKPVTPEPLLPPSEQVVGLARSAVGVAAGAGYAFFPRDNYQVDTVALGPYFSDELLQAVDMAGFKNCVLDWVYSDGPGGCNITYRDSLAYGMLYPWGCNSQRGPASDTLRLLMAFDTAYHFGAGIPEVFAEFDALRSAYFGYFGYFDGTIYTADHFFTDRWTVTFYPRNSRYDSVEYILNRPASSDTHLVNGTYPDSGFTRRINYWNADTAVAASGLSGLSLEEGDRLIKVDRLVHFRKTGGLAKADSVSDVYSYHRSIFTENRTPGKRTVLQNGDTIFAGECLPDSSVIMELSDGRSVLARASRPFAPTLALSAARDTLVRIDTLSQSDSLEVSLFQGGLRSRSFRLAAAGAVLSMADSTSLGVMRADFSGEGGRVRATLRLRAPGGGADLLTGTLFLDLYTRQGTGVILDPGRGISYQVEINLDGTSRVQDIVL
jgi:hypothetical protein